MYVYVSDKWNIIMKSNIRLTWLQNQYREYSTAYTMEDNLIFEENQIKKYENSKQYIEDTNRYHLNKEVDRLNQENKDLTIIANSVVKKETKMARSDEPTEYNRKIYLLKNKRW